MSAITSNKVFVMMSGGVDSSVAALLLRDQGFDVTGVYMKNWSPMSIQSLSDCPWKQDLKDAKQVAEQLGIKFRSVNFEREYRERVVEYFLDEYRAGHTPNPDIMCNQEIKFGAFYDWAKKQGADMIASGHYAQIVDISGKHLIKRGFDKDKDQSYFLWSVDPAILKDVLFPIGGLAKSKVRKLAAAAKLVVAKKKDSQGICFIGHINVSDFLKAELGEKEGDLLTPGGQVVGKHQGAHLYTIGQRHGFDITKPKLVAKEFNFDDAARVPIYVVGKNMAKNQVLVGVSDSRSLLSQQFIIQKPKMYLTEFDGLKVQIRHQGQPVAVEIDLNTDEALVKSQKPLTAVADGQFAVLYDHDLVIGGGRMKAVNGVLS